MYRWMIIRPDGTLSVRTAGHWREIRELVRERLGEPYGADAVRLLNPRLMGWVNGDGHHFPLRHPRNVIGSVVLAGLGATPYPYAGTVAITGWHPSVETMELSDRDVAMIRRVYHDALFAVSYRVPLPGVRRGWGERMRDYARHVEIGPVAAWEGRPYTPSEMGP